MIELVRAKLTHTYADARGLCYGDAFNFSDLLEPPEEERVMIPPKLCNSGRLHNYYRNGGKMVEM